LSSGGAAAKSAHWQRNVGRAHFEQMSYPIVASL
jgi:hypothetical protein